MGISQRSYVFFGLVLIEFKAIIISTYAILIICHKNNWYLVWIIKIKNISNYYEL